MARVKANVNRDKKITWKEIKRQKSLLIISFFVTVYGIIFYVVVLLGLIKYIKQEKCVCCDYFCVDFLCNSWKSFKHQCVSVRDFCIFYSVENKKYNPGNGCAFDLQSKHLFFARNCTNTDECVQGMMLVMKRIEIYVNTS